jgi:ATP synthase F1 epsilon subunit
MAEVKPGHLRLVVVTPRGEAVAGDVLEVQAPGAAGEFGVLPGHIPFLAAIDAGVLSYRDEGAPQLLAVGPGFVEVALGDRVVVLTESTARPDEIDLDAVTKEEQALGAKLVTLSPIEHPGDYTLTTAEQAWARARRETVQRHRAASSH